MISALLDANVLYPAPIRDLLLNLAEDDLFKPFWSNEIRPDAFVIQLISRNPIAVFGSFEKLVSRLKNPPQSKADVLDTLVKCDLPETARVLAQMEGKSNA